TRPSSVPEAYLRGLCRSLWTQAPGAKEMGTGGQGRDRPSVRRARTGGCCSRRRKREESEKVASWLPGGKQHQRIRGRIWHLEKQSRQSLQIRRGGFQNREKPEGIKGRARKLSH